MPSNVVVCSSGHPTQTQLPRPYCATDLEKQTQPPPTFSTNGFVSPLPSAASKSFQAPETPYQHRLSEIYTLIQYSLSSRAPASEASNILTPFTLPLYTAAASILESGLASPSPIVALNKHALAEALETCLPSAFDPTNPDPLTLESEHAIKTAKMRFIEFLFGETERLGTRQMIEVADYVYRVGGHCSGYLESVDDEDDEDVKDRDPGTPKKSKKCIEDGDSPEISIKKLLESTQNASTSVPQRVNLRGGLNKQQVAAATESMRNRIIQQLSTSNSSLDSALNVLLLIKHLGDWNSSYDEDFFHTPEMDASMSQTHKLKLVELLYEAAKSFSKTEMQDFLERGSDLMMGIGEELELVAPQDRG